MVDRPWREELHVVGVAAELFVLDHRVPVGEVPPAEAQHLGDDALGNLVPRPCALPDRRRFFDEQMAALVLLPTAARTRIVATDVGHARFLYRGAGCSNKRTPHPRPSATAPCL